MGQLGTWSVLALAGQVESWTRGSLRALPQMCDSHSMILPEHSSVGEGEYGPCSRRKQEGKGCGVQVAAPQTVHDIKKKINIYTLK